MDKAELVRAIYERKNTTTTMKDLDLIVEDMFAVIRDILERGEKVDISGFGTFDMKDAAIKSLERFARNDGRKKAKP